MCKIMDFLKAFFKIAENGSAEDSASEKIRRYINETVKWMVFLCASKTVYYKIGVEVPPCNQVTSLWICHEKSLLSGKI